MKVGAHPLARPLTPSSPNVTLNPWKILLYFAGSTLKYETLLEPTVGARMRGERGFPIA